MLQYRACNTLCSIAKTAAPFECNSSLNMAVPGLHSWLFQAVPGLFQDFTPLSAQDRWSNYNWRSRGKAPGALWEKNWTSTITWPEKLPYSFQDLAPLCISGMKGLITMAPFQLQSSKVQCGSRHQLFSVLKQTAKTFSKYSSPQGPYAFGSQCILLYIPICIPSFIYSIYKSLLDRT